MKRTCYRLLILNFVSLHRWVCIDTWLIWCVSLGFVVCGLIEALQLEVFYFQMTSKFLVFPLDIDTLGLVESKGTEIELSISLIMQHLKKKKNSNMLMTHCFASNRLELELVFDYDNSFFMNPNYLQLVRSKCKESF